MKDSMKAIYDEDPKLPKPETIDRNEGVGTMPENSENKKPIIPEVLKRDCPHLSGLQRGEQLRILIAQGCSKRGLARELGCSPALIRQLIELSEASSDE